MLNRQIPMKAEKNQDGSELLVHSIFNTLQGEGIFAGRPAVFLRLGGCNLQCPQCDTEYVEGAKSMSIRKIIDEIDFVRSDNTRLVVISGGEPFRQKLGKLIHDLTRLMNWDVQIETNGTLYDDSVDYTNEKLFIMCSPKTGNVHRKLYPYITAFKYVGGANELLFNGKGNLPLGIELQDHGLMADGLPERALGHTAKPHIFRPKEDFKGIIYLQPIDRQDDKLNALHTKAVVESCIKHGYTLCLQLHKFVGVE